MTDLQPGQRQYAPPGTPSRYYETNPADPEAPRVLAAYHGRHHGPLAPGDAVAYANPAMPGLGSPAPDGLPLTLAELVELDADQPPEAHFTDTAGGEYECSADNLRAITPPGQVAGPYQAAIDQAVKVLFAERHRLPPDVLRSLADIWVCASAARYGEPGERFWEDEPWANHDTAECEGDAAEPAPWPVSPDGTVTPRVHVGCGGAVLWDPAGGYCTVCHVAGLDPGEAERGTPGPVSDQGRG